jgi:hypothetical protein
VRDVCLLRGISTSPTTAVEGQIDQFTGGDDAPKRVAGRVDELRAAGHLTVSVTDESSSSALIRTLWLTLTSMASRRIRLVNA